MRQCQLQCSPEGALAASRLPLQREQAGSLPAAARCCTVVSTSPYIASEC